jgi:hypothetical protein
MSLHRLFLGWERSAERARERGASNFLLNPIKNAAFYYVLTMFHTCATQKGLRFQRSLFHLCECYLQFHDLLARPLRHCFHSDYTVVVARENVLCGAGRRSTNFFAEAISVSDTPERRVARVHNKRAQIRFFTDDSFSGCVDSSFFPSL